MKFIRRIIVTTAAGTFTDLHITFDVAKTLTGEPNEATITITNLTDASRALINEEGAEITLEAGYEREGNVGVIFKGYVRDVVHEREDTDIITTIEAGDGDKSQRESYVPKEYPEGTTPEDMVRDIQTMMKGVELGELKFPDEAKQPTERPTAFMAPPHRALDELGRSFNFYWSVQNGALECVPGDGFLDHVSYITPQTGMIGKPTITDAGIIVKVLLDPDIRPNRQVYVQSETTDREGRSGLYRVSSIAYGGDNRNGEFYCELEAELINGGKTVTK